MSYHISVVKTHPDFSILFDINPFSLLWMGSWKVFLKLPFNQVNKISEVKLISYQSKLILWLSDLHHFEICSLFQVLKINVELNVLRQYICINASLMLLRDATWFWRKHWIFIFWEDNQKIYPGEKKTTVNWSIHDI